MIEQCKRIEILGFCIMNMFYKTNVSLYVVLVFECPPLKEVSKKHKRSKMEN